MTDGIIFDMDGTIWDTRKEVCEAWNYIFEKNGYDRRIDEAELSGYMGMTMDKIAANMFPDKPYSEIEGVYNQCLKYENEYILKHGAILYPELEATLEKLSKKYRLFIVSNCQSGYIEAFFEYFGTGKYFKDILCNGDNNQPKDINIKKLVKRNGLKNPVYVGDTAGDAASSASAGVRFCFARYGFGKVDNPDYIIDSFAELTSVNF